LNSHNFVFYLLNDFIYITQYFFVFKAYDLKPSFFQIIRTLCIADWLIADKVITTINFDNQALLKTDKVWYIPIYGMLSTESNS